MAALTPDDLRIHADFLRRLAVQLLRSPDLADDAVQETMVLAWNKQPDVESHRGWLAGVLRNVARNVRRGEQRRASYERVSAERTSRSPAAILEREETRTRLLEAILSLPDAEREVVLLRYDEGLPPRKIATSLDIPVHTVHNRLRSGLTRMRADLDHVYGGDDRSWRGALVAFVPGLPASSAGLALGGLLVGKKLIALVAVLALISLATWFVLDAQDGVRPDPGSTTASGSVTVGTDGADEDGTAGLAAAGSASDGKGGGAALDTTPRVHGRVIDPETGAPVVGARITAFDYERLRSVTTTTDAEGRFELPESRAHTGAYHLVVEYTDHSRNVLAGVTASADGMTLVRREGGFIEGRLIDMDDAPVTRYRVTAVHRMFQPGEEYNRSAVTAGVVLPEALTVDRAVEVDDAQGAFRVGPLQSGVHVLVFQVDGHPPLFEAQGAKYYSHHEGIVVKPGQATRTGLVRLPRLGHVDVRVIDAQTEQVLEDVSFASQLFVNGRRYATPVAVESRGRDGGYVIPVAVTAQRRVASTMLRIETPGYGTRGLSLSGHVNGARMVLRMTRSAGIRATILRPDGQPAAGDIVLVRRDADRMLIARAALDADGMFAADDLPAVEHLEIVVLDSTSLAVVQVFPIALVPGETRDVTLGGPNQTALEGVLIYRGEPLEGALVSLDTPNDRRVQIDTDANGFFRFDGIVVGPHELAIAHDAPQLFVRRAFVPEEGKVLRFEIRLDHLLHGTTTWTNPDPDDSGLGNPSLLARLLDGEGFTVSTRVKNDGGFELPVPEARVYVIESQFNDYLVPDAPRVDASKADKPLSVVLMKDPADGKAIFHIVDADTGEAVVEADFDYRSGTTRGGGTAVDGVATGWGLYLAQHHYVFQSPVHVSQPVTIEIRADQKLVEQTIRLVRSNGVQIMGFGSTSRAREAGIALGDVILVYSGTRVRNRSELGPAIRATAATDVVRVELLREGHRVELDLPGGRMGVNVANARVDE